MQNAMHFIVEQQVKFEENFAATDRRFVQAEKRHAALERLVSIVIRRGDRRMARAEAETAELKATLKSFLQAMRRSAGNGKSKALTPHPPNKPNHLMKYSHGI